jgi:hypothetical protein
MPSGVKKQGDFWGQFSRKVYVPEEQEIWLF